MKTVEIVYSKHPLKYKYIAYEDGRIYSEASHKFLAKHLDKDGYEKVRLVSPGGDRHTYSIHRLMLENFLPRDDMDGLQVNHIDGDKKNNHLDNLEWTTCSENILHAHAIGLKDQSGQHNNASKLTEKQVLEIIDLLLTHQYTYKQIGDQFGVNEETIGAIKRKKNWRHLTENIDFN